MTVAGAGDTIQFEHGYGAENTTVTVDNLTFVGDWSNGGVALTSTVATVRWNIQTAVIITGDASNNAIYSYNGGEPDVANDHLDGGAGDDLLSGGVGNDGLIGGAGKDTLLGGDGNDQLHLGFGELPIAGEIYNGGAGDDTLHGNAGDYSGVSFVGLENIIIPDYNPSTFTAAQLHALSGQIRPHGNAIVATGGAINFSGSDLLMTGLILSDFGNTVSLVGATGSVAVIEGGTANDTVTNGNVTATNIDGNGGDDSITGGTLTEALTGGDGRDTLNGGGGNDTMPLNALSEIVSGEIYNGGSGTDTLTKTFDGDANLSGVTIAGIERFITNNKPGVVTLTAAQIDGLSAEIHAVDGLVVSGAGAIDLNGTALQVTALTLSAVGNTVNLSGATGYLGLVEGGNGHDVVSKDGSIFAVLNGNGGNDSLTGGSDADTLNGGSGNDTLTGGDGVDRLAGGIDDDTYVDVAPSDIVTELTGEGRDTIRNGVATSLASPGFENIENLVLTGAAAIDGIGNALKNLITGNAADNRLDGGERDDTLDGGNGNDTLDGGTGADVMTGGLANDTYFVDTAQDRTIEAAGEGSDTVYSSLKHTLAANAEHLVLTGTRNLDGTGNTLDNNIQGNAGDNALAGDVGNDTLDGGDGNDELRGGGGADSMTGGIGNDRFFADDTGDVAIEDASSGTDTVFSTISWTLGANLELLRLQGSADIAGTGNELANKVSGNSGANLLRSQAGNDTIDGKDGADTLEGGEGNDTLSGGSNADVFRFASSNAGVDTITDFSRNFDRFDLSGGAFTAVSTAANGDAVLIHSGGAIRIQSPPNLTLAQWNALVLPSGAKPAFARSAAEEDAFDPYLPALIRSDSDVAANADFVFA